MASPISVRNARPLVVLADEPHVAGVGELDLAARHPSFRIVAKAAGDIGGRRAPMPFCLLKLETEILRRSLTFRIRKYLSPNRSTSPQVGHYFE